MAKEAGSWKETADLGQDGASRKKEIATARSKRAELAQALGANEPVLWKVLEMPFEAVLIIDERGLVLHANQAVETFFGYMEDELLGRPIELLVPSANRGSHQQMREGYTDSPVARPMGGGKELHGRHKDGREFPIVADLIPLRVDGLIATVCYIFDMTSPKKKAMEFTRLRELNAEIVQSMEEGIVVCDEQGFIRFVNPRMAELLGYSERELLEKHWRDIVVPEHHAIVQAADERRERNIADRYPIDFVGKDGERVQVLVSGGPLFQSERYVGTLAVITDIRELEKAHLDLRASEERFRNVSETANDAVIVADEKLQVVYWNRAAEVMFSRNEREALGKPLRMFVAERSAEKLRQAWAVARQRENQAPRRKEVELLGVRGDGSEFPLTLSVSSWVSGGKRYHAAIIRDVTEARHAQERALLQNSLAAVGQMAAGIAHDFNNILGTIILYAEMVIREPDLSLRNRERLNVIFSQAKRGAALTTQILDFSRRAVMERQPMDLVTFLKGFERLLSRTMPESIRIRFMYEDDSCMVSADPGRLQQGLMNLALNARDAMPSGGELRIELRRMEVATSASAPLEEMTAGEWVRIAIADTGIGIAEEALPHLFEPFFTTKPSGTGSGLGLAQVYGIVKQHEGHINITSKRGEGTTVEIFLPALVQHESLDILGATQSSPKGDGETILVVEDDEPTRNAVGEILQELNYKVLMAQDGREALKLLQERSLHVRLVLSDLVMPNLGGVELFKHLRNAWPSLPIVFMTGYPLGDDTQQLLENEHVIWMQKPLSMETVSFKLQEALSRSVS
jgi:two-component system cell cycle sensor histidine kinase/response regulator CckA